MRNWIGVLFIGGMVLAIDHCFGPIGVTRCFGALFLCAAAHGCVVPTFNVSLGPVEMARLSGWKKGWVLLPQALLGLAIVVCAPSLSCLAGKYRHLCA